MKLVIGAATCLTLLFWALDLAHPVHVVGSGPQPDPQRTPQSLTSRLDFPARTSGSGQSLPAVSVHWYQGVPPILVERGPRAGRGTHTARV
ncbi:MAG: hypothetical protein NTY87_10395 [Planctomycetia bacterium]|nr:hypothetical protein [Planctomycetia bacterium]